MPPTRAELVADCGSCHALCCVGLPFSRSADFGYDKPAGEPCRHLRRDDRCGIHDRLPQRGFPGCVAYDCFGAGQRVSQVTYGGRHWRDGPAARGQLAALPVVHQLHEVLWYLDEVLAFPAAAPLHAEARALLEETDRLAGLGPEDLPRVDVAGHRTRVGPLLRAASRMVRAEGRGRAGRDLAGRDLAGRDLRRQDLRRADLRGALLLGARLEGVDLGLADLLGADLRGADLRGADLADALFVTRPQVAAARTDARTRLPAALAAPTR
ncbi:pentapeptide repeat-containing protein [Vallicoccus soli]|uniref:Pentapeptide repeat-containing protein n=1 Tax=Vallicoccus soli TaxID=2339232 RepID=A0A3A3YTU4_9ACTN|nr:pentapeptide repeat-containing protein [Vallicoccus soli]RJK94875.1 pentapeptide repeat-containing protein [Vallicoccus soli]